MSRGPDVGTLLARALSSGFDGVSVTRHVWRRWASATFVGARHELRLSATDSAGFADWLSGLSNTDFDLRGHLVADIVVIAMHRSNGVIDAEIEALTVES